MERIQEGLDHMARTQPSLIAGTVKNGGEFSFYFHPCEGLFQRKRSREKKAFRAPVQQQLTLKRTAEKQLFTCHLHKKMLHCWICFLVMNLHMFCAVLSCLKYPRTVSKKWTWITEISLVNYQPVTVTPWRCYALILQTFPRFQGMRNTLSLFSYLYLTSNNGFAVPARCGGSSIPIPSALSSQHPCSQ